MNKQNLFLIPLILVVFSACGGGGGGGENTDDSQSTTTDSQSTTTKTQSYAMIDQLSLASSELEQSSKGVKLESVDNELAQEGLNGNSVLLTIDNSQIILIDNMSIDGKTYDIYSTEVPYAVYIHGENVSKYCIEYYCKNLMDEETYTQIEFFQKLISDTDYAETIEYDKFIIKVTDEETFCMDVRFADVEDIISSNIVCQ